MLPSRILVLTSRNITLFPLPELHPTDELDDVSGCQSTPVALWSWPLDEERIGPFRRFSCPDYNILNTMNDPLHLDAHRLFFYLTGRHLFTIFPRDPSSVPIEFVRLAAIGISLPRSLQESTRVLLGPSGKRGVWVHTSPGSSRVEIQLVDFWGQGYCPQLWAKKIQSFSSSREVVMRENHGYVSRTDPIPQGLTFDEDLGILVLAVEDTLVVYRF